MSNTFGRINWFDCDIANSKQQQLIEETKPDIIFHIAESFFHLETGDI